MYDKKQLSIEKKEEQRYERSKKVIIKGNITQFVYFKFNKIHINSNILTFLVCFAMLKFFFVCSASRSTAVYGDWT